MISKFDPGLVARLAADGHSKTSAARELNVSRAAVYRAEGRLGVRFQRGSAEGTMYQTHRERVSDMKPMDAVDYLLDVIEVMERTTGPGREAWLIEGVRLTRAERNMFYALARANGRVLQKDALLDAVMAGREGDDAPEIKIVDVYACKMRQKLKGQPFRIVTHWGLGYSIDAPPGQVWPWEVSA